MKHCDKEPKCSCSFTYLIVWLNAILLSQQTSYSELDNRLAKHETPTEFEILYCMMQHINSPVTLATLLDEVWGYGSDEDVRMVRVHVGGLRQKIEENTREPKYLHTVVNVGYKLTPFGLLDNN